MTLKTIKARIALLVDIPKLVLRLSFLTLVGKLKRSISQLLFYNPDEDGDSLIRSGRLESINTPRISHTAFFVKKGNAGDILLPAVLQDLINTEQGKPYRWDNKPIQDTAFTDSEIQKINKTNGLIIGGGGLFLKDTNANDVSGWQWNCSVDKLRNINVPICLFAVGYNRFRDQDDFNPIFFEHVNLLAEKTFLIGLRNHGSITALKSYIAPAHHHKIRYQPCMTTLLSRIYPTQFKAPREQDLIAINCAFDRSHLRYGNNIGEILNSLASACKLLSSQHRIAVYSHLPLDDSIIPFLQTHGVPFERVALYRMKKPEIIRAYRKPALVIAMRGHAQMIPFGVHTPTISLISHDKMAWFLEDISSSDWGIEINDLNLSDEIVRKAGYMLENFDDIQSRIRSTQDTLYRISQANIELISNAMNL